MNGRGGNNVLELNVTGTPETANGASANNGTNLANYNLGTPGSIRVSAHEYQVGEFQRDWDRESLKEGATCRPGRRRRARGTTEGGRGNR
jgi:hypothetical protein